MALAANQVRHSWRNAASSGLSSKSIRGDCTQATARQANAEAIRRSVGTGRGTTRRTGSAGTEIRPLRQVPETGTLAEQEALDVVHVEDRRCCRGVDLGVDQEHVDVVGRLVPRGRPAPTPLRRAQPPSEANEPMPTASNSQSPSLTLTMATPAGTAPEADHEDARVSAATRGGEAVDATDVAGLIEADVDLTAGEIERLGAVGCGRVGEADVEGELTGGDVLARKHERLLGDRGRGLGRARSWWSPRARQPWSSERRWSWSRPALRLSW